MSGGGTHAPVKSQTLGALHWSTVVHALLHSPFTLSHVYGLQSCAPAAPCDVCVSMQPAPGAHLPAAQTYPAAHSALPEHVA